MKSNKIINRINIFFILLIILISNITTYYSVLPVSSDECGYLGQAKLLAGENWSNVISQTAYYSYGCGILPSFIMRLRLPYFYEYKLILILNSIMLVAVYFIALRLIKLLYNKCSDIYSSVIALILVLYPSNIGYSNFLLAENYLTLMIFLMSLLMVSFVITHKYRYIIICSVLCVGMFYVHNRAIAVVASFLLCMIVFMCKSRNKKVLAISCVVIVLALLYLGNKYKLNTQSILWVSPNEWSSTNDIAKVSISYYFSAFFNRTAMYYRLIMACGKTWYIIVATFGIVAVGVYYSFKYSLLLIKRNFNVKSWYALFSITTFLGVWFLFFIIHFGGDRIDHIIIGRYLDSFIGPILLIGLCELTNNDNKVLSKILLFTAFIVLLFGKLIEISSKTFVQDGTRTFDRISNIEWAFMWDSRYSEGTFFIISIISIIGVLILISLLKKDYHLVLFFYLLFNVYTCVAFNNMVINEQKNINYSLEEMADIIDEGDVVGFIPTNILAVNLQYMLPINTLQPIYNTKSIEVDEYEYIYSKQPVGDDERIIRINYDIVYESDAGYLYKRNY